MSLAALEDRTFESAVELTPDQVEANKAHFEGKGYTVEVEDEGAVPPVTPNPAEVQAPAEAAPAALEPVEATPAAATPPGEAVDEETQAEWNSLKNDGEKLGRAARKTKRIKELEEEKARQSGVIEELQRQLEKQKVSPPATPTPEASSPAGLVTQPKVEPAQPAEPPKAKEFEKPRPTRPKFEDFRENEDAVAAFSEATAEFNENLINWNAEKRDFEAQHQRQIEQSQQQANREVAQRLDAKLAVGRAAHADFDQRVNTTKYTPVLQHLIVDVLKDGQEIAYQLSLPENKEAYDRLTNLSKTAPDEDQQSIIGKIFEANAAIAEFRYDLKHKASAPPATIEAPAPPAPAPAAAIPPKQTPPVTEPPKREEAAPAPVRGRNAPTERIEDIDPMDSDARREFKKRHGLMS